MVKKEKKISLCLCLDMNTLKKEHLAHTLTWRRFSDVLGLFSCLWHWVPDTCAWHCESGVIFFKGCGSPNTTMSSNTCKKASSIGSRQNDFWSGQQSFQNLWQLSENNSWEKTPFKSGRSGAVLPSRVGQIGSWEMPGKHLSQWSAWLQLLISKSLTAE